MNGRPYTLRETQRFSPAQCRAARGFLAWSTDELARRASLERESVEIYEAEEAPLGLNELAQLGQAFNRAGMIAKAFGGGGDGVRFVRSMVDPGWRTSLASPHATSFLGAPPDGEGGPDECV